MKQSRKLSRKISFHTFCVKHHSLLSQKIHWFLFLMERVHGDLSKTHLWPSRVCFISCFQPASFAIILLHAVTFVQCRMEQFYTKSWNLSQAYNWLFFLVLEEIVWRDGWVGGSYHVTGLGRGRLSQIHRFHVHGLQHKGSRKLLSQRLLKPLFWGPFMILKAFQICTVWTENTLSMLGLNKWDLWSP